MATSTVRNVAAYPIKPNSFCCNLRHRKYARQDYLFGNLLECVDVVQDMMGGISFFWWWFTGGTSKEQFSCLLALFLVLMRISSINHSALGEVNNGTSIVAITELWCKFRFMEWELFCWHAISTRRRISLFNKMLIRRLSKVPQRDNFGRKVKFIIN
jgi:hypothetical protein